MTSPVHDLVLGLAGSGGDGVVSAGESLLGALSRAGYHAIMTKSFGSQIRGGEASCRVRCGAEPVLCTGGALDVAVAMNWEDFFKFGNELPLGPDTLVVYEAKAGAPPEQLNAVGVPAARVVGVPIQEATKAACGTDKAKMSFVLGLFAGWFGIPESALAEALGKKFRKKGEDVVETNAKALRAGAAYAGEHPIAGAPVLGTPAARTPKLLCDGNDMCAAAAIFSGVEFFGGYPITPSTEVMQALSRDLWQHGGAVLQAEDEIAGIGSAVGASFAGKKSMTATSGPGMSLKTELLGLASIAELPLVVLNVQRGGPSTGLPTKTEQADLFQAAFSAHGDVLRPVLAPTSVADTFRVTVESFNIAERYQTPVILLSDQEISQRKETVEPFDTSGFVIEERKRPTEAELAPYLRFRATDDHVSPISHPGLPGGAYQGAGIEHNEKGEPTNSGDWHARMNTKRFAKLDPLLRRSDLFELSGELDAPIAMVSWGSSAGVAREALRLAQERGIAVKLLVPYLLHPVATEVYRDFLASVRGGFVLELSHQGQLYKLLRMELDLPHGFGSFARSGANPFQPAEVLARLESFTLETVR